MEWEQDEGCVCQGRKEGERHGCLRGFFLGHGKYEVEQRIDLISGKWRNWTRTKKGHELEKRKKE